ncbi:MAG: ribosome small subunit-dependent GTPase A [Candidatus Borkfalkiaceae bacterium]|nr:ribosome small subunit-dependent GTPase A [Christensenellaceae bacterium]
MTKAYPRKNRLYRPNVSNVDAVCILVSCAPAPDFLMIDKMLLTACHLGVQCALVVNKSDLNGELYGKIKQEFAEAAPHIFGVSAATGENVGELKNFMRGKNVVLAGQSAVGKTTLTNAVFGTDFKTGELSDKLNRGKHTTTFSRIIKNGEFAVYDTPGFSEFTADVDVSDAAANFPPYEKYLGKCKYCDCTHTGEPFCSVDRAVKAGELSKTRYERYKQIYAELKLLKEKKY